MPNPIICRLTIDSVEHIHQIENECNRPVWSRDLIAKEFMHPHAIVLGARVSGVLAGFIIVHVVADEAHVVNFGVRQLMRSRGIGRALIEGTLVELHERAVRRVTLEVREGNRVARSLYESLGFNEAGLRQHYYSDDGEHAVLMALDMSHYATRADRGEGKAENDY